MGRFSQLAMVMKLLIAVITLVIAATIVSSEDANEVVMIDVIPAKHVILSANETKARQGLDMDYSKHAKSSVGGEHDPGYGQASKSDRRSARIREINVAPNPERIGPDQSISWYRRTQRNDKGSRRRNSGDERPAGEGWARDSKRRRHDHPDPQAGQHDQTQIQKGKEDDRSRKESSEESSKES